MLGLIVFITIFAVVVLIAILTINTARQKKDDVNMEISEFKLMLEREGLSDSLIDFCLVIIHRLQKQNGSEDDYIINSNVLNKLNGWDYSNVLNEEDYEYLYSNNFSEINDLHDEAMNDHGFIPSDVGEAKHTEDWSQSAQHTEAVITQKISDVVNRYKSRMV